MGHEAQTGTVGQISLCSLAFLYLGIKVKWQCFLKLFAHFMCLRAEFFLIIDYDVQAKLKHGVFQKKKMFI